MSCHVNQYLYNTKCVTACPSLYFANQLTNTCELCLYPCELCVNASTICTSCVDGYLLNNTCLPSCPVSYYEENVGLICLSCPFECSKCASLTNCLQCQQGYKLHKSRCVLSCPTGYYSQFLINTTTAICSRCVGLCSSCLNQTFCLSCNYNFLVSNGTGVCLRATLCSLSQFANIDTLKCEPCASTCLSCFILPTFCIACPSGLVLYNGTCIVNCPSIYFFPAQANGTFGAAQCSVCEQPCLTCADQNKCLSCTQGYKYSSVNNLCSSTCSVGSFFNLTINDCMSCSSNCLNCDNQLFCYVCKANTYLNVISSTQNECITQCPDTYYSDSLACMKCLFPCLLCSSSIDCISCQTGVLYQKRCISACP